MLYDETRWQEGSPPERDLVAFLAVMSRPELDRFLREMAAVALSELEASNSHSPLTAIRSAFAGALPQILDEAAWSFPGGDFLLEALQAIEASDRLWANALESLRHSVAAAQLLVGAVVEHRDHQRDPSGWAQYRAQPEKGPMDPGAERRRLRRRDRQEMWRALLRGG